MFSSSECLVSGLWPLPRFLLLARRRVRTGRGRRCVFRVGLMTRRVKLPMRDCTEHNSYHVVQIVSTRRKLDLRSVRWDTWRFGHALGAHNGGPVPSPTTRSVSARVQMPAVSSDHSNSHLDSLEEVLCSLWRPLLGPENRARADMFESAERPALAQQNHRSTAK